MRTGVGEQTVGREPCFRLCVCDCSLHKPGNMPDTKTLQALDGRSD